MMRRFLLLVLVVAGIVLLLKNEEHRRSAARSARRQARQRPPSRRPPPPVYGPSPAQQARWEDRVNEKMYPHFLNWQRMQARQAEARAAQQKRLRFMKEVSVHAQQS